VSYKVKKGDVLMAVPKFFDFFDVFLHALEDGESHSAKEVLELIASRMNITDSDRAELLPSGKKSRFYDRVLWARTYLNKAGLIETPHRGIYRITSEGRRALSSGEKIDLTYLEQSEAFQAFRSITSKNEETIASEDKNESPMEILDSAYQEINAALASQIMDEVMKLSPSGFEKLVVRLLLNMGTEAVLKVQVISLSNPMTEVLTES
jgi:restriction system protein